MRIDRRPFDKILSTIVWKITETCNMACPYCFMFKSLDKSFLNKPITVSQETIQSVVMRIKEYVAKHSIASIDVTLHGGEPLLIGAQRMKYLLQNLSSVNNIQLNIQTNATLIDDEFINLFKDYNVSLGASLDSYPEVQNKTKMKNGKDSYPAILQGVNRLLKNTDLDLFKGVLSVIDLDSDPMRLYNHFLKLGIKRIEFLLPLRNHFTPYSYNSTRNDYFNWLKPIFNKYIADDNDLLSIRIFDSIIDLLIGSNEPMCSIRHSAVDMLTIDTDGSIQLIDDLRICGDNFVDLGLSAFSNSLDSFFSHPKVINLYNYEANLPQDCIKCRYLNICGSGGHAFRYNGNDSFNEPSIYCNDTYKLIEHIENSLYE